MDTQDWFECGQAVMRGGVPPIDDCYPPLNDIEAQRLWLGGFGAAWAEANAPSNGPPYELGEALAVEPVGVALIMAMKGRMKLLEQLQSHGRSNQTRH